MSAARAAGYSPANLARDFESGKFEAAYFILGEEDGLRTRARKAVLGLVDEEAASMDLEVLDGAEAQTDWPAVAAAVRTLPWMSDLRVVVVDRADEVSGDPADMLLYLDNPSRKVLLALVARKVDRRMQPWKSLTKLCRVVSCDAIRDQQASSELRAMFQSRGLKPNPRVLKRVLELAGSDIARLESEVEKLALLAEEDGSLAPESVDALLGRSREREVWAFTDALARRDKGSALRVLGEMLDDGSSEHYLLAMAAWNTRRLLTGLDLAEEGRSRDEIAKEVKAWGANRDNYFRGLKSWTRPRLRKTLQALAALDRDLKSSRLPDRLLIERFVLEAAG